MVFRRWWTAVASARAATPARAAAGLAAILLFALASGCSAEEVPSEPDRLAPRLLMVLDPGEFGLEAADADAVPVGIFLSTREFSGDRPWTAAQAVSIIRQLAADASAALEQCGLSLTIETAQVIVLPADLLRLQGNARGSFGGHPPPDIDNPRLFNYEQDERLTDEARALFAYGKQHTRPNTIAVFTVDRIVYWIEDDRVAAGGLSFPPNVFHRQDDYPQRNSVVLQAQHPAGGGLPTGIAAGALGHELAHMLLNTGLHTADRGNLMSDTGGRELTSTQCADARENRVRLFGAEAVPDPGPPAERP